jgi:hypothetical protein
MKDKKTIDLSHVSMYPRWEFVRGGCGRGHWSRKGYGYYIDAHHYTAYVQYDRSGKRDGKNWVLNGGQRFATLLEAQVAATMPKKKKAKNMVYTTQFFNEQGRAVGLKGGSAGGKTAADNMTTEERSERAIVNEGMSIRLGMLFTRAS